MAKYKKRADGRYATSIQVGHRSDGKPKLKTLYGKTIRELENKVAEFKSLQNKGIVVDDKSLTLGEWAKKWLELYKKNKSYNTYEMYRNAVGTHIIPTIGNMRLGSLKKHMLQELLNKLVEDGKERTAEVVRLTLNQIIASAIDEQYIYVDITRGLTLPKKTKKEKRALTDDELIALKDANLTAKERAFAGLMIYAGLRRGEALALTLSDIDLQNRIIHVNKTVIFKKNTPEIKNTPKSDSGVRDVPIPDELYLILKTYLMECVGAKYIFTMERTGELISMSSLRKLWGRIITKANLSTDVTPHICRHTYATKLFYGGVDAKTAQKLLGHANISMTLDIYTHLQSDAEDVRQQINSAFNPDIKTAEK